MICNKEKESIIFMKKIVTVIVAAIALCLMLNESCEAAATTKATTKDSKTVSASDKTKQVKKTKKTNSTKKSKKSKNTKKSGKAKKKQTYTASDLRYMTSIIYCEARGESYAGQKAVGIVVMNRVRSKDFPNTIKDVIYESGQFSPVRSGSFNRALNIYDAQKAKNKFKSEMKTCRKAALEVLKGSTTIKVDGKNKEMKNYHFFSRSVKNAKFVLGGHQFK